VSTVSINVNVENACNSQGVLVFSQSGDGLPQRLSLGHNVLQLLTQPITLVAGTAQLRSELRDLDLPPPHGRLHRSVRGVGEVRRHGPDATASPDRRHEREARTGLARGQRSTATATSLLTVELVGG